MSRLFYCAEFALINDPFSLYGAIQLK